MNIPIKRYARTIILRFLWICTLNAGFHFVTLPPWKKKENTKKTNHKMNSVNLTLDIINVLLFCLYKVNESVFFLGYFVCIKMYLHNSIRLLTKNRHNKFFFNVLKMIKIEKWWRLFCLLNLQSRCFFTMEWKMLKVYCYKSHVHTSYHTY